MQQFTPEQMGLFQSLFSQVGPGSSLSKMAAGDESSFQPMEDRAMRDFQEFQGQTASRFSGLAPGAMSARGGSGFQNTQTQGSMDFASRLAEQRQSLQRQALGDLLGISESLLQQRPYENFLIKRQPKQNFFSKLFGGLAPAAGAGIGAAFGGLPGAAIGGQLGSSLSSGFQPTQY
jgi:hypothetical protein